LLINKENNVPETSVVMTSYNYASYIESAINSVIDQRYNNWELIIVDDGSSDDSLEIIKRYTDKYPDRIKLLTHPNNENRGIKESNELAFANITGEYTAFLESDDIWKPNCLEEKITALKNHPEAILAFSDIELIIENGFDARRHENYLKYSNYVGKKCSENAKDLSKMILFRNPVISFSNIIIRSIVLDGFTLLREHEIWSDWQLVIKAASMGKFIYVDNKLLFWRLHNKSMNYSFIQNDIEKKKHELLLELSDYLSKDERFSYPFNFKCRIFKIFHDLGFGLRYPNIAWSELKRSIGK
jgi:glycosyltransferase involved in cell wall biosynthesis